MNKCLNFFRIGNLVKISACDNVKNELKRMANYQYSQLLKEKGIIEECLLLLSVDNADILRDCIIRCACSISEEVEVKTYYGIPVDNNTLIQILANNECTYYDDSIGELLNDILKQRVIYNFFKSYDNVETVRISELFYLDKNNYKDKNGFILYQEEFSNYNLWYLITKDEKILFGLSIDSNIIQQFSNNRIKNSESRFAHIINEKYFEEYVRLIKDN